MLKKLKKNIMLNQIFNLRSSALIFITCFLLISPINSQDKTSSSYSSNMDRNPLWLDYQYNHTALYDIISAEAFKLLKERKQRIAGLTTKEDWLNYQQTAKVKIRSSLSNFSKTDLNPKLMGVIKRPGFTVEKIVFESQPGFYVTACLFLPKNKKKPAPAVIVCPGHTANGLKSLVYQNVSINLVEKGFVVLMFDPIGQGERLQYPDAATGQSVIGVPTNEHSHAGAQTLLNGVSLTDYFVWDIVRAIDYLETRKEVDIKRLGITGRSGGGLQSALLMAYEDRIYAAAPECYITNFTRLFQSIGSQDAEQNPYRFIANGFDQPDFLHLHAPKPALIITTTNDFFNIQGARETYAEASLSYKAFGVPQNLRMVTDFGKHESTKKNREALYAFFMEYLNVPGDPAELATELFSEKELQITPTGQVISSFSAETVYSLNRKFVSNKKTVNKPTVKELVDLAGVNTDIKLSSGVFTGIIQGENRITERYFLENNSSDYALPLFVIKPKDGANGKPFLWLNPVGKKSLVKNELIDSLLNYGYNIIIPDLPGIGELKDTNFQGDGFVKKVPFNYTFGANLVGKSVSGIQAEALLLINQFVNQEDTFKEKNISALIEGPMCMPFMIYAAINNSFDKILFVNAVKSNSIFTTTEFYNADYAFSIPPGFIPSFDFDVLLSFISAKSLKVFKPLDSTDMHPSVPISVKEILDNFK